MQVSGWKTGESEQVNPDDTHGLRLGDANRDAYCAKLKKVSVEICGVIYVFSLTRRENFWTTCPEIRDSDLEPGQGTPIRDYLYGRGWSWWPRKKPPHFELMPLGNGSFRLEPPDPV